MFVYLQGGGHDINPWDVKIVDPSPFHRSRHHLLVPFWQHYLGLEVLIKIIVRTIITIWSPPIRVFAIILIELTFVGS
jgi:hypothetical protein